MNGKFSEMSILFFTFLVLNTSFKSGVCELLCYNCNSLYDGSACERGSALNGLSLFVKPCEGKNASYVDEFNKPLCRKIEQRIKSRNNMRVIKRSCGYELQQNRDEDLCYTSKSEDHEQIVCQCMGNLCNTADIKTSNIFWNVTFCLLIMYWYYK